MIKKIFWKDEETAIIHDFIKANPEELLEPKVMHPTFKGLFDKNYSPQRIYKKWLYERAKIIPGRIRVIRQKQIEEELKSSPTLLFEDMKAPPAPAEHKRVNINTLINDFIYAEVARCVSITKEENTKLKRENAELRELLGRLRKVREAVEEFKL